MVSIKALMPSGLKLYALQKSESDAVYSTVTFDSSVKKYAVDGLVEKGNKRMEKEAAVGAVTAYYTDSVLWQQSLNLAASDGLLLKGTVNYLYKKEDEFIPGERTFRIAVETEKAQTLSATANEGGYEHKSLGWIFLIGFLSGFGPLVGFFAFSLTLALPFSVFAFFPA